jgi:hypothetical protein
MPEYIVYRHGWNDANQPRDKGLPEKMPVVRIEANSPEEACFLAAEQVSLFAGQYFSAEPADAVDAQVNNISLKAEALEREGTQ